MVKPPHHSDRRDHVKSLPWMSWIQRYCWILIKKMAASTCPKILHIFSIKTRKDRFLRAMAPGGAAGSDRSPNPRNPSDGDSTKAKARQAIYHALGPCYHRIPCRLGTPRIGWICGLPGKDCHEHYVSDRGDLRLQKLGKDYLKTIWG